MKGMEEIFQIGCEQPVPADRITAVLVQLRTATCAMTELERSARGGEPVKPA